MLVINPQFSKLLITIVSFLGVASQSNMETDWQAQKRFLTFFYHNNIFLLCCNVKAYVKKMFVKLSQNFIGKQQCQSLFFNKSAGLRPATLLKKSLWHRYFPVNFVTFPGTLFFTEHFW